MSQLAQTEYDHRRGAQPLLRKAGNLRRGLLLATKLLAFGLANAFLYCLAGGKWLDFSIAGYRQAIATPIGEMLLSPLSLFEHPWMIAVAGLLLAVLISMPIIMAILYRSWVACGMALTVALVGHCPLLAAFLGGGILLAARTRLRSNLPFLAFLVGLTPVMFYLYFFGGRSEQVLMPKQQMLLYLPFVGAVAGAILIGAVVLFISRLTKFRPGVLWPMLLVLVAAPMWLFHARVGWGELHYAVLAGDMGPGDAIFRGFVAADLRPAVPAGGGDLNAMKPAGDLNLLQAARTDLVAKRAELVRRCDDFLWRYPSHSRAPAVMWIRAAAMEVVVDAAALNVGMVKYAPAGPTEDSRHAWEQLAAAYPSSPQGMVARYRLAIQLLRERNAADGYRQLASTRAALDVYCAGAYKAEASTASVFGLRPGLPGLEYYRKVLGESVELLWLLWSNGFPRDSSPEDIRALAEYMRLGPFSRPKSQDVRSAAAGFEQTCLGDDFRLLAAMAEDGEEEQAGKLAALAEGKGNAAVAANYELGKLLQRLEPARAGKLKLRSAREYLVAAVVVAQDLRSAGPRETEPPPCPYLPLAQADLDLLDRKAGQPTTATQPATRPATQPASRPRPRR